MIIKKFSLTFIFVYTRIHYICVSLCWKENGRRNMILFLSAYRPFLCDKSALYLRVSWLKECITWCIIPICMMSKAALFNVFCLIWEVNVILGEESRPAFQHTNHTLCKETKNTKHICLQVNLWTHRHISVRAELDLLQREDRVLNINGWFEHARGIA